MKQKRNLQTICFLAFWALPSILWGATEATEPQVDQAPTAITKEKVPPDDTNKTKEESTENTENTSVLPNKCQISAQFSNLSYSELKTKLENALQQKNKSSIFLIQRNDFVTRF